ncbi:hypothetical protein N752_27015 [Desulforamulus aquiferis]|nr:hypothetical protein [Desulforamulus aquiferis]RYD02104.1 hypothetical protein N752_27015 [Desulforamulus aquiferis]
MQKGITNNGFVQIPEGLREGDLLVVKGQEYINENSQVTIINNVSLS